MKTCSICKEIKSELEFYRDNRIKYSIGFLSRCIKCTIKNTKKYRLNNRERVNETARNRRRLNKEATNAKNRESYYKNRLQRRANQKKYERMINELSRTDKIIQSKIMIQTVKTRCRKSGILCTITYKDIIIPDICPILGIPIKRNKTRMAYDSISIDRIIPEKGYVPGNIIVISFKANAIKQNATPDEILRVGNFYKELMDEHRFTGDAEKT